jgi:hydrogenase maturation protease
VTANKILLLALGNDILGDDAAGLEAGRLVNSSLQGAVEFEEHPGSGFALMDIMTGYHKVLILDSIVTGKHPPGTVLEYSTSELPEGKPTSPHYAGLPDLMRLAEVLSIPFPEEVKILALEVEDVITVREQLTPAVEQSIPHFADEARRILENWEVA